MKIYGLKIAADMDAITEMADDISSSMESSLKPYYDLNDDAHNFEHALSVKDTAISYFPYLIENKLIPTQYLTGSFITLIRMVVNATMCHDMFSKANRDGHHEQAAQWFLNTCLVSKNGLSQIGLDMVANAILEHRSSYTGEYSTIVSEITAAADVGHFNCEMFIERSFDYALSALHLPPGDALLHAMNHIGQKFGSGEFRVPTWYQDVAGADYTRQRNLMTMLSKYNFTDVGTALGWIRTRLGTYDRASNIAKLSLNARITPMVDPVSIYGDAAMSSIIAQSERKFYRTDCGD